jgi:hypothetical protein
VTRPLVLAALLVTAALGLAACGGDDEPAAEETAPPAPVTETATEPTETEPSPPPTETQETDTAETEAAPPPPGEEEEGGGGDEEPIRTQARFTGREGRVSPRVVQVIPFIAVEVSLRSADGRGYRLEGDGTLEAGGTGGSSAPLRLDGLRPGSSYRFRTQSGQVVRVVASAEPGP